MEIIKLFKTVSRTVQRYPVFPQPDFPVVRNLPYLPYHSLFLCRYKSFFLEPFDSKSQIWCHRTPQYFNVCFLKNRDTFLHESHYAHQNQEINTIAHSNPQTSFKFYWFSPIKSFIDPGSNIGSHVAFNCHVSLVSFYLEQFWVSPSFHDLDILERTGQLLCRMSISMCLPDVSSWLDLGHAFWKAAVLTTIPPMYSGHTFLAGIPQKWCCVLLNASYQKAHDVDLSHCWWHLLLSFGKMISARLCNGKLMNKYCLEIFWDYVKILFLITLSPIYISIQFCSLTKTIIIRVTKW